MMRATAGPSRRPASSARTGGPASRVAASYKRLAALRVNDGDDPPPLPPHLRQYEASDILRAAGADVPEEPARKTVKKKKKVVKKKKKVVKKKVSDILATPVLSRVWIAFQSF